MKATSFGIVNDVRFLGVRRFASEFSSITGYLVGSLADITRQLGDCFLMLPRFFVEDERTMRARKAYVSPIKTTYGIRLSG